MFGVVGTCILKEYMHEFLSNSQGNSSSSGGFFSKSYFKRFLESVAAKAIPEEEAEEYLPQTEETKPQAETILLLGLNQKILAEFQDELFQDVMIPSPANGGNTYKGLSLTDIKKIWNDVEPEAITPQNQLDDEQPENFYNEMIESIHKDSLNASTEVETESSEEDASSPLMFSEETKNYRIMEIFEDTEFDNDICSGVQVISLKNEAISLA